MTKGITPRVLAENGARWATELLAFLDEDRVPPEAAWNRYKHVEVKEAVQNDSHGKCIYCESKILHIDYGNIEHMKPKSKYPQQTYAWENLGLVCSRCNIAKSDQYDDAAPPVNPYEEEPDNFLIPLGQFVWPRPGNDRGNNTESLVQLNRAELIQRRLERLEAIWRLAEAIARAQNATVKATLTDQLCEELMADREYAFVARAAAKTFEFNWEDCPH